MCTNIYKTQSISKGIIGPKIMLATTGMLLLGSSLIECGQGKTSNLSLEKKSPIAFESPTYQAVTYDDSSSPKGDCNRLLGALSYLKNDHNLGFVQIDPANLFGEAESKKMAVIFYAARSLKDCSTVHLSNQGVMVTYLDGSSEVLRSCIEVDGEWLDGLSKEKEVEPLFHTDSRSRLEATCAIEFATLSALDYGIQLGDDTNGVVLLEGGQDKTRFEDRNHAGFMVTKRTPASISGLVQLVRHLSTNTVQSTNMICPASVCGNRLQPAAGASDHAAYCYIKNGNRYRLVPFNNSASTLKGHQYDGGMDRGAMQQVVASNLRPTPQEGVPATDGLKKTKQTADMEVQTEASEPEGGYHSDGGSDGYTDTENMSGEDFNDDGNDGFIDDDYNDNTFSSYFSSSLDNDDNISDVESDTDSIFGQGLDASAHSQEEYTGDPKAYNGGYSLEDDGTYSDYLKEASNDDSQNVGDSGHVNLLKKCDNEKTKLYYKTSFSKKDQEKLDKLPD